MSEDVPAPPPVTPPQEEERWILIRELLAFQLKLALDALRDFLLSPISLIVGVVDLSTGRHRGGRFDQLLRFGRRTDAWINLFGGHGEENEQLSVDLLVERMEGLLLEQVERGGVTASAKAAIDRSLDALSRAPDVSRRPPPPE